VAFDKITSTFIIRIFGRVDENEVPRFFEEYENYAEQVSPSAGTPSGTRAASIFRSAVIPAAERRECDRR